MERYKRSLDYLARAVTVTPGGAQTLSKRAGRFPEGAHPVALEAGDGAYVFDLDGHRYLDMICGLACMTLGYGNSMDLNPLVRKSFGTKVNNSVHRQIQSGASFSLAHPLEAEVAEKLCVMIPCAEQVRFVKTGSEATEAAIRVARKATGRKVILTVGEGFHGWHSWFQAVKPEHPGIPYGYELMVRTFAYNDLITLRDALYLGDHRALLDALPAVIGPRHDIAAVILEPCHYEPPAEGFLRGVRDLCTQHGAVLIFDEMVTGFRWANGGGQEYFGVTPDLACFGKAMANGFPLACLCGKVDLMKHADVVSGTFGGETLSLAACNAVLDIYKTEPIIDMLWARGQQFQQGFNDLAQVLDVPAICDGFAVKPRIRFDFMNGKGGSDEWSIMAMSLFLQETALRGILWHPAGGNVSVAMTKQDIEFALTGMGEALVTVKKALASGDWSVLQGKPIQSTSFVRKP